MSPQTIMKDSTVEIDTSKFVVKGTTYAIRAIRSVSVTKHPLTLGRFVAFYLFLFGAGALTTLMPGAMAIGGFMLILGAWLWARSGTNFCLNIKTGPVPKQVLKLKDRTYLDLVQAALERAIAAPQ